jgi:hypothetical protein
MSELTDFREAYHQSIAEAHSAPPKGSPMAEPTLPPGHWWTDYTPKPGPAPARKRRPSAAFTEFAALFQ